MDAQARLAHAGMEADRRTGAGFPLQARGRVYDLRADPGEEVNLAHSRPDVVEISAARMEATSPNAPRPRDAPTLSRAP